MIKRLLVLFCLILMLSPILAFAQGNPCTSEGGGGDLPKCVNQIYFWSLGIAALLAMLMMVLGGYLIMTAAGNAQQSERGKEFIWSAIVGLGLLFAAYLILNTINPDLVDFTNFPSDPFAPPAPTPIDPPAGGSINVNPNP